MHNHTYINQRKTSDQTNTVYVKPLSPKCILQRTHIHLMCRHTRIRPCTHLAHVLYIYMCVYIVVHTYMQRCVLIHMHNCSYIIHMYVYTCTHMCVYNICACMYTHLCTRKTVPPRQLLATTWRHEVGAIPGSLKCMLQTSQSFLNPPGHRKFSHMVFRAICV